MGNDIFAKAVDRFLEDNHTGEVLAMLDAVIVRGDGARLIEEVVLKEQSSVGTQETAISRTMQRLEALAENSPTIACSLMAYLLPLASKLRMHDICDSIFLWIGSCDSEGLTDQLESIAQAETDADMRRHYEQLVRNRRPSRT